MSPRKPKIAVFMVTSGWFREVGLQSGESDLTATVENRSREVMRRLDEIVDAEYAGVLYSVARAKEAGIAASAADVDGVLVIPLMWCEDQIVRAALAPLGGLPLLLWTFAPTATLPQTLSFHQMLEGSGSVAALQLSGMLKRERRDYYSVVGHMADESVYREIAAVAWSFAIKRRLAGRRIGVLPFRCDQMSTTYVDEMKLRSRYGVELDYIQVSELAQAAANASSTARARVREYLQGIGARIDVDETDLEEGIRYAVALEAIATDHALDALAINDVIAELHEVTGLRPCLPNPRLTETGVAVSMEADVAAAVAMTMLWELCAAPPFYTEVFNIDFEANALLLGHAGYHDPTLRDPDGPLSVVPDVEYEETDRFGGASIYFKYKPGPVTVVNSVWSEGGLSWTAFEAHSLPGPAKLAANCHLFCRPTGGDVGRMIHRAVERGVSQHWIVVPGHRAEELSVMCRAVGVSYSTILP